MTTALPLLNLDDSMGLGTPNFFSSAWNLEENDFSFTEAFTGNRSGYTPQLLQAQAENNQPDCFSGQGDAQFGGQSVYQPRQSSGLSQSNEDLDRILGNTDSTFLEKNVGAADSVPTFDLSSQADQMQGLTSFHNLLYSSTGLGVPSMNSWNAGIKPTASPARIMTQTDNEAGRRTSLRYGQITPVDSPPDESLPPALKGAGQSSKNRADSSAQANGTPKTKKPRKSKKKPMTKEQEELKRKRFLERNRLAADKCRQNRKKWIDDLQTKAHYFGTDNTAKKAQLEELEQEIVQLRSLLFIHSRSCNEKDIAGWVEQEANKVQLLSDKDALEDRLSILSQSTGRSPSPISRPPSSHVYGSVSEAISHRYSDATAGDDCASVVSAQGSRRPSTVL